jgi:6-phosphofructokinase 1
MKIGMLTSGGDCQGLNATLRGVAKTLYNLMPNVEIYGIIDGYKGLIEGTWCRMEQSEFSGILRQGGTILGASRQPFKAMRETNGNNEDKLSLMLKNYKHGEFDALVILGGNGTHKSAHMLHKHGVNVVTLPKTIDNDVYGSDLTFGFDSAVDKATSVIDAIHTTAAAHGRVFVIEVMGHKVGWLTLYAGIAGGADVILIPEIPYAVGAVLKVIERRNAAGKNFSIIAIAEGAITAEEAALPKKERKGTAPASSGEYLANVLNGCLDQDVRVVVPGHFQRGGEPTPTDRVLCSRLGAKAGELIRDKKFGRMVALRGNAIVTVPLEDVAGKLKYVPHDCDMIREARLMGISFGDYREE